MAAVGKLKNVGKKIIEYPEESAPVVSSVDWVKNLTRDPKRKVS